MHDHAYICPHEQSVEQKGHALMSHISSGAETNELIYLLLMLGHL